MERSFLLRAAVQYRAAARTGGGLCRFILSEEYREEWIKSCCSPAPFWATGSFVQDSVQWLKAPERM